MLQHHGPLDPDPDTWRISQAELTLSPCDSGVNPTTTPSSVNPIHSRVNPVTTHPVILVCCHCHELCLGKYESFKVFCAARVLTSGIDVDHMESGLVSMHRVQYHLKC